MLALFAEIERDLIIARTKEGLQLARSKGKILGRPRGKGKSRLDQYREEITTLLQNGSTKKFISHKYGVTSAALLNWIKKNN